MLTSSAFFALFDQVAAHVANPDGPNDADAFLHHVAPDADRACYPEDWTPAEMASALHLLATYADDYDPALAAQCREAEVEADAALREAEIVTEATAAERFALALADAESAASFAVYAHLPSERFNPRVNDCVADGLTFTEAGEVAARLRAEVPELVYATAAAPLAVQMARAAARLAESRRTLAGKGRAVRDGLDTYAATVAEGSAFPALSRRDAVEADEADLFAHLSASGCRFNVRQKLADSADFTLRRGGSSLAIPSKLKGTAGLQDRVGVLAGIVGAWDGGGSVYVPTVLHALPEGFEGGPGVAVLAAPNGRTGAVLVGYLQDKHARWITPLLNPAAAGTVTEDRTPIRVYVTAVTGGEEGKPTRGVNVVITGAAEAVRQMWAEAEREDREARAYESGNPVAVEALLD